MGRHLENKRKLMPVRILISVGLISKNIVNSVSIVNDSVAMNSNFREYYWDEQCTLRIFL